MNLETTVTHQLILQTLQLCTSIDLRRIMEGQVGKLIRDRIICIFFKVENSFTSIS